MSFPMSSWDAADLVKTFPSKTLWDKSYGKEKEYLQIVNAKTVTPPESKCSFVMKSVDIVRLVLSCGVVVRLRPIGRVAIRLRPNGRVVVG